MGLQRRSIQKLFREDFPGARPLVVDPSVRDAVAADLKALVERFDGVDVKDHHWLQDKDKPRHVFSFSIIDSNAYYYHSGRTSFRLFLDDSNRLTIKEMHDNDFALVSDLDEVVRFVRNCKQRLERLKALQNKRGKVRDLLTQAILAHVRKLAKLEHFDFMSQNDALKFNLFVKLSDDHAIVFHIPFKDFKQHLPGLGSAIATLRQLYQNGTRFQIVGPRGLPSRNTWVTHQSL